MAIAMKVLRELAEGRTVFRALGGDLDERFDATIVAPGSSAFVTLDLDRVMHVSSFGVREWIRALQGVRKQLSGLFFVRASPRLTDQFNMVVDFDGGGSLLSFRALYHCEACNQ